MSWFYASAEAKPVGPISEEELHALRLRGTIQAETYIIEYTGQPPENWNWRRYQELFPAASFVPPPPVMPVPAPIPAPVAPAPVVPAAIASAPAAPAPAPVPPAQPHPLFPSATPLRPAAPVAPPAPGAAATTHPAVLPPPRPTNGWCGWGFGLGIAGLLLSFACGIGLLLALPAILFCLVGLFQVQRNRNQSGTGLAITGLVLSGLALLVSFCFIAWMVPMMKGHYEWSVTEQTSNDSE